VRRTRRTLRRLPLRARQVAELGNELHRLSARAHQLAEQLAASEGDVVAISQRRVSLPGCDEHEEWQPDCKGCYKQWATTPQKMKATFNATITQRR